MSRLIATVLGVGYLRPAPGTWGSLAALPLFYGLHLLGGIVATVIGVIAVGAVGYWSTKQMTQGSDNHDPSEIVIDEVLGQWIALLPVSYGAVFAGADILALWPGWVVGFAAFRLFDIWKPWLVGRADRRNDAVGVMLDDAFAGVFAAIVVFIAAALYHIPLIMAAQ